MGGVQWGCMPACLPEWLPEGLALVIAFAQPRMGSLEVMKSRSPGREKRRSLRGRMCRRGGLFFRGKWPRGSQGYGEPCKWGWGPGLCPFRGPGQALRMHGSVWSLVPDPSFFLALLLAIFDGRLVLIPVPGASTWRSTPCCLHPVPLPAQLSFPGWAGLKPIPGLSFQSSLP